MSPAASGSSLPSWNDGATRQSILNFVADVTREGSPDFVPPADRIATFDNDGTLWVEHPMYTQLIFAFDRVKAMAPMHPEWKDTQPFKAALEGDMKTLAGTGEHGLIALLMATHPGMTAIEFQKIVVDWIVTARDPHFKRPYTELAYQPMLELLAFLRTNGFKTFIVSGGGIEFIRPWAERVYGVPPEQVVGSSIKTEFQMRDGRPELFRLPEVHFVNDNAGKPVGINQYIGRRPIAAFGNSDGDLEMLQWTTMADGRRLGLIVHHTDAEREYAYDRDTSFGRLDKALDAAATHKWTVVDMKNDWKRIFAFDWVTPTPRQNQVIEAMRGGKSQLVGAIGSAADYAARKLNRSREGAVMSLKPGISRRALLMTGALLPIAAPATAQVPVRSGAGFSFAAVGDTRPMMYLPLKEGQPDLNKFFVEMYGLVMPEKIAEAVVKRDVKLIFDPVTKELIKVIMPFASKTEVMTLTVDKGWVTEASVEDVKLLPGVHRTMFRLQGGEWVTREIVKDVQSGRAKFVVNSGDAVWWGNQGLTVSDSPYWKRVNDTMLKKLPAPDDEMRAAGLDGRFFMSVGNHEVWADPKIEGVLSALPYLRKFGVTPENLIYKFDFKGTRFIYLWSGKYDYRSPSLWDADRPKYAEQVTQLQKWMDEAKANGIRKAFIVFHYPVFARSGLGPVPAPDNPHKVISSYAKDMEVIVLNGHVHTTEIYDVDGVKYLMLGGGGAEQDPILPGRTSIKVPADYPPDLYWKGQPPQEEYNYVLVDVEPDQKTKFTLNRFRPWSAEPFGTEELFT